MSGAFLECRPSAISAAMMAFELAGRSKAISTARAQAWGDSLRRFVPDSTLKA